MQHVEIPDKIRDDSVFSGGFPELITRNYKGTQAWYNAYLNTFVQKDLRIFINIQNIELFTTFLRILAANVAQPLNLSSISREIGASVPTPNRWTSVLEQSYIIFLLRPYYRNLGKRLIKSPKVYFIDTGLLGFLTGITSREQFETGILYGAMFENYIISEMLKKKYHEGLPFEMYFFRSSNGEEIDLILDYGTMYSLIEIKASETYRPTFHKTIEKLTFTKVRQIEYSMNLQPGITRIF